MWNKTTYPFLVQAPVSYTHLSSYNLRCKVMSRIGKEWWQVIYFAGHLEKVVLKKRYRQIECKKEEICNEIKELRRTV